MIFFKPSRETGVKLGSLVIGDTFKTVYDQRLSEGTYMRVRFASSYRKDILSNLVGDDECPVLELNTGVIRLLNSQTRCVKVRVIAEVNEEI